ncbi:putative holin-like toxin [Oenococcus oeni]
MSVSDALPLTIGVNLLVINLIALIVAIVKNNQKNNH